MPETVLFLVFVVHAAVFLRVYLVLGRRASHLVFAFAFLLLAAFQAASRWLADAEWLLELRYTAYGLLAVATALFLVDLRRRRREL